MLSIVIPALNEGAHLPGTLESLSVTTPWPVEIVVSDGGSVDATVEIAREHGALIASVRQGRGQQLAAGADRSSGDWLFFLHADTRLSGRWFVEVDRFISRPENRRKAAYCQFALDDKAAQARDLERRVAWRSHRLGMPYGDQGLLISRGFYRVLGGFRPYPVFEDVDLVRRIGRCRLVSLPVQATTSAD
ncbi:MAG: glycosyltransferase, partial [Rhodospirillaceae bacterium]|nr:glycosyltransferase [Rhodospirillaceae bacterium]